MQLAPGPAHFRAVFLDQPLARAVELQAGAIHQQVHALAVPARSWPWNLQRLGPAAQRGVVRHRQSEPKQADDGADQALCLTQGQMEDSLERQCGQDRQRRIPGLPARGRARLRSPARDCLVRKPDRQTSALAQAGIILTPVHDLVPLPGNMMAAVLVQLEQQDGHPSSGQGRASYAGSAPGAIGRVRATKSLV